MSKYDFLNRLLVGLAIGAILMMSGLVMWALWSISPYLLLAATFLLVIGILASFFLL